MRNLVVFLICSFLHVGVKAGVLVDAGGTYLTDNIVSSTTNNSSKYGYGVGVLFSINKNWWGGWGYSGFSFNETNAGATTTLTGQDTGPTLLWQFGKNRVFNIGATYNILSQANYSISSGAQAWTGTSFAIRLGAAPELKEGLRIGFSLNYFSASYSKKKVNNVESGASYSRNWLYPAIGLIKEF